MVEESDHKLYAKVMCSMCLAGNRGGVFTNCPYCNVERKTYVEASFNTIKEHLKVLLTTEQKSELVKFLNDGSGGDDYY
jgi:hypothetical protein